MIKVSYGARKIVQWLKALVVQLLLNKKSSDPRIHIIWPVSQNTCNSGSEGSDVLESPPCMYRQACMRVHTEKHAHTSKYKYFLRSHCCTKKAICGNYRATCMVLKKNGTTSVEIALYLQRQPLSLAHHQSGRLTNTFPRTTLTQAHSNKLIFIF